MAISPSSSVRQARVGELIGFADEGHGQVEPPSHAVGYELRRFR